MKKINIYSPVSKTVSTLNLPKDFDEPLNEKLLAQAIHVYRFLSHQGKSKTLTRGEVARTTQKWYRQKGTGRARHGARSAPIFVGGSKAHGPKDLKKNITLPKKMRIKALKIVLSQIAKDRKIAAISNISKIDKTKTADNLLKNISKSEDFKSKKFTIALSDNNSDAKRFFRNIKNVEVENYKNLNAYKVFLGGNLILDKDIFATKK